jgi:hypothetical protein
VKRNKWSDAEKFDISQVHLFIYQMNCKKIITELVTMTIAAFIGASSAFFLLKWESIKATSEKHSQGHKAPQQPVLETKSP